LLYQAAEINPSSFHDITIGNNTAYQAGQGWDACTGLGSPKGKELLNVLYGLIR